MIPEEHVPEFKKKLIAYYEGEELSVIAGFLKKLLEKFLGVNIFYDHSKQKNLDHK